MITLKMISLSDEQVIGLLMFFWGHWAISNLNSRDIGHLKHK